MTVKKFFKSDVFKSLAVLLAIVIVAGALLAIFSDLLAVSDEERLNRAIASIYGADAKVEQTLTPSEEDKKYANGTVEEAHKMSDGNYLIKSEGNDAYGGGTVAVWVVIEMNGNALGGVGKVKFIESRNVSKYYVTSNSFFGEFDKHDSEVAGGKYFSTDGDIKNITAGATASSRAINNAVNTAIDFVKKVVLKQEVVKYTYVYEKYVDMKNSTMTADLKAESVAYSLTMNANGDAQKFVIDITVTKGVITAYEIKTNGSTDNPYNPGHNFSEDMNQGFLASEENYFVGKTAEEIAALLDEEGAVTEAGKPIVTGATYSNTTCVRAAAFATANFEAFLSEEFLPYSSFIDTAKTVVSADIANNSVTFTLTTKANSPADKFVIDITVTDGVIADYKIKTNGSTEGWESHMHASVKDGSYFVGKTLDDVTALLDGKGALTSVDSSTLQTDATYSVTTCVRAAMYALKNYEAFMTVDHLPYANYMSEIVYQVEADNTVVYTLTTKANSPADKFVIDITVTDGAIADYKIKTNGSTEGWENNMHASVKDGSYFVGKTLDDVTALLDGKGALTSADSSTLQTEATYSVTTCVRAAMYALKNYETILSMADNSAEGGTQE